MTVALDVRAARAQALFCSTVQPADKPDGAQVAESIAAMARSYGTRWCTARIAQEYGEHPDIAAARMRWARELVDATYPKRRR